MSVLRKQFCGVGVLLRPTAPVGEAVASANERERERERESWRRERRGRGAFGGGGGEDPSPIQLPRKAPGRKHRERERKKIKRKPAAYVQKDLRLCNALEASDFFRPKGSFPSSADVRREEGEYDWRKRKVFFSLAFWNGRERPQGGKFR